MAEQEKDTQAKSLDRLIKLLMLTTSNTDAEALSAARMANTLLERTGWTWEKLLRGKVTIVADPFSTVESVPQSTRAAPAPRPQTPPPPQQTARPFGQRPTPPPRPQTPPSPPPKPSLRRNSFAGFCWCCGDEVAINCGSVTGTPSGARTSSAWIVLCASHAAAHLNGMVLPTLRAKRKQTGAVNISAPDLSSL